jgi:hypothetical protein
LFAEFATFRPKALRDSAKMHDVDVLTVTVLALVLAGATLDVDQRATPKAWFGPVTVTFGVQFTGNPFDPQENDCRVLFSDGNGKTFERLAYFDNGTWKATLVAPDPGTYKATLIRNSQAVVEKSEPELVVLDKSLPKGYIQRDPTYTNRFRYDSGERWFPVGHNLGWPSGPLTFDQLLGKMKETGTDWARIWACPWSNFNPWWNGDPPTPDGQLWAPALDNWGKTLDQCEKNNVKIQMVLFHHGLVSTSTNSNWADHPWNAAKGGFLKNPEDFFTDPEAERRTKIWLRYAVARWAHSPSIMAWELFNEIEWTDGYKKNLPSVVAWHNKMAAYIRSIDPYGHLITTSSSLEHPEIYESMDYYQPHAYPVDLTSTISTAKAPTDKPLFFGECGLLNNAEGDEVHVLRDALYTGMLANQAATGMYWSWDRLERLKLFGELKSAADVVQVSRIADRPNAKPVQIAAVPSAQNVPQLKPFVCRTLSESDWMLSRITVSENAVLPLQVKVTKLILADGDYEMNLWNLDTGEKKIEAVKVKDFELVGGLTLPGRDVVIVLQRKM